jgi:hypothetical protein
MQPVLLGGCVERRVTMTARQFPDLRLELTEPRERSAAALSKTACNSDARAMRIAASGRAGCQKAGPARCFMENEQWGPDLRRPSSARRGLLHACGVVAAGTRDNDYLLESRRSEAAIRCASSIVRASASISFCSSALCAFSARRRCSKCSTNSMGRPCLSFT